TRRLVVEHEEQIIRAADNLIDLGPGRGKNGGELVWSGPLDEFVGAGLPSGRSDRRWGAPAPSLTRDYLTGNKSIALPKSRRTWTSSIKTLGHRQQHCKSIEAELAQGLHASAFSFNSGNGRCERCSGTGYEKVEMQFLSDLYVRCAECEGKRFQPHVLRVQLEGKSIHNVLELTITEAIEFFAQIG